jgi:hypothetical protein
MQFVWDFIGIGSVLLLVDCLKLGSVSESWESRRGLEEVVINFLKEGREPIKNFITEIKNHFEEEQQNEKRILPEHDFTIVGAVSARSVLAKRMS